MSSRRSNRKSTRKSTRRSNRRNNRKSSRRSNRKSTRRSTRRSNRRNNRKSSKKSNRKTYVGGTNSDGDMVYDGTNVPEELELSREELDELREYYTGLEPTPTTVEEIIKIDNLIFIMQLNNPLQYALNLWLKMLETNIFGGVRDRPPRRKRDSVNYNLTHLSRASMQTDPSELPTRRTIQRKEKPKVTRLTQPQSKVTTTQKKVYDWNYYEKKHGKDAMQFQKYLLNEICDVLGNEIYWDQKKILSIILKDGYQNKMCDIFEISGYNKTEIEGLNVMKDFRIGVDHRLEDLVNNTLNDGLLRRPTGYMPIAAREYKGKKLYEHLQDSDQKMMIDTFCEFIKVWLNHTNSQEAMKITDVACYLNQFMDINDLIMKFSNQRRKFEYHPDAESFSFAEIYRFVKTGMLGAKPYYFTTNRFYRRLPELYNYFVV